MSVPLTRPSIPFATVSTLVIAGNLLLLSAFIGEAIVEPNLFAIMGGLFILPLCILMAVQQYRGTFRCVQSAATTTSVLLYVLGGFLIFGVVTSAGEAIANSISLAMMGSILVPMLIVAAC